MHEKYIPELSTVEIRNLIAGIYAEHAEHAVEPPKELKQALALWDDDSAENVPRRIESTMNLVHGYFQRVWPQELVGREEAIKSLKDTEPFATNITEHANDGATANAAGIMKEFCEYLILVSKRSLEEQIASFFAFPPKTKEEIACLGGSGSRLKELIRDLSIDAKHRPFITAADTITSQIVERLKYNVPSNHEVHIPMFMQHALGFEASARIRTQDFHYLSPQSYIPAEMMWDILVQYPAAFTQRLNTEIADEVDKKVKEINDIIEKFPNIKDVLQDISSNDKRISDAAKLKQNEINAAIKPLQIHELTTWDEGVTECHGWESAEKIREIITKHAKDIVPALDWIESWRDAQQSRVVKQAMEDMVEREASDAPQAIAAQPSNAGILPDFHSLYKNNDAARRLLPLLTSNNENEKLLAIDTLWVLGEPFLGSSPIIFVTALQEIYDAVYYTQNNKECPANHVCDMELLWGKEGELYKDLPDSQKFKVERIKDRYEHYLSSEQEREIVSYFDAPEAATLDTLIKFNAPVSLIAKKINADSVKLLTKNHALKLAYHPQRKEIMAGMSDKNIIPEPGFLRELIAEAAIVNDTGFCMQLLEKFVKPDNIEAVLGSVTRMIGHQEVIYTALIAAAKNGNQELVQAIIDKIPQEYSREILNIKDQIESTALMHAAQNGHEAVVQTLIDNGADVNTQNNNGHTAFMFAVQNGHEAVIMTLIDNGADVNAQNNNGDTAFMFAVQNGHEAVILTLIDNGADVNVQNNNRDTALMLAAWLGNTETVKILIDNGADVNVQNNNDKTALNFAVQNGHEAIAKALIIDGGADVNRKNSDGYTALMIAAFKGSQVLVDLLVDARADVNERNNKGYSALMHAAQNGHLEIAKNLASRVEDINAQDRYGVTALMIAIRNGHVEVVRFLIDEKGASVDIEDNQGFAALTYAIQNGNKAILEIVVSKVRDINMSINNQGMTALMAASLIGRTEIVHFLLNQTNANVHLKNNNGFTALIGAAQNGHEAVVRELIAKEADVNATNMNGDTALILAAQYRHTDVVRALIEGSPNVNAANEFGLTALMLAAWLGNAETVKILIDNGADIHATQNNNLTALQMAKRDNRSEIVNLINVAILRHIINDKLPEDLRGIIDVDIELRKMPGGSDDVAYPVLKAMQGKEEKFNKIFFESDDREIPAIIFLKTYIEENLPREDGVAEMDIEQERDAAIVLKVPLDDQGLLTMLRSVEAPVVAAAAEVRPAAHPRVAMDVELAASNKRPREEDQGKASGAGAGVPGR